MGVWEGRGVARCSQTHGSESPVFDDAPVSGGVPGAVAASLPFMVSISPAKAGGVWEA